MTTSQSFEFNAMGQRGSLDSMAADTCRLGQGGLVQLRDATPTRTDLRLTHNDQQESLAKAEVAMLLAAGTLIEYLDGTEL